MKENVIVEKSYRFAVNILKAVKTLNGSIENYVLVKQLIRTGTSIGQMLRSHREDIPEKTSFTS